MDYYNKFVGYIKELHDLYPGQVNKTVNGKTGTSSSTFLPVNLYGGFGLEEYIFFGLVLVLFMALFVMKYDSYRFFRMASREIRQDVARDVKQLLDAKFNEEFFDSLLQHHQGSQYTQVDASELHMSTSTSNDQDEQDNSAANSAPKTPRQSRIPVAAQVTPVRRSNSDASPINKSDRGDPGRTLRPPFGTPQQQAWAQRNHVVAN